MGHATQWLAGRQLPPSWAELLMFCHLENECPVPVAARLRGWLEDYLHQAQMRYDT